MRLLDERAIGTLVLSGNAHFSPGVLHKNADNAILCFPTDSANLWAKSSCVYEKDFILTHLFAFGLWNRPRRNRVQALLDHGTIPFYIRGDRDLLEYTQTFCSQAISPEIARMVKEAQKKYNPIGIIANSSKT